VSVAGFVLAAILCALGAIHFHWGLGGELGKRLALPLRHGRPVLQPTPTVTFAVAAGFFALALLVVLRSGWGGAYCRGAWLRGTIGLAGAAFVLRALGDFRYVGFLKTVRAGRFARLDTFAYSPLSLLLGILCIKCAAS